MYPSPSPKLPRPPARVTLSLRCRSKPCLCSLPPPACSPSTTRPWKHRKKRRMSLSCSANTADSGKHSSAKRRRHQSSSRTVSYPNASRSIPLEQSTGLTARARTNTSTLTLRTHAGMPSPAASTIPCTQALSLARPRTHSSPTHSTRPSAVEVAVTLYVVILPCDIVRPLHGARDGHTCTHARTHT